MTSHVTIVLEGGIRFSFDTFSMHSNIPEDFPYASKPVDKGRVQVVVITITSVDCAG